MHDRLRQATDGLFPELVRLRRQLHQHPELAFEEYETAKLVAGTLAPLDVTVQTGIAKTGVVATLRGGKPGPTVLLRADMDALPILEENTFDFKSQHPGKMHACGHDSHTAGLLGVAMLLHAIRDELHGSVRFLFQPSEERIPGGAKPMIEAGVLAENATSTAPEVVFGQHVAPFLPTGTIGVRDGMFMASTDELFIDVRGEGGHGAEPHKLASDAVLAASQIVVALQHVISRPRPPGVPSVLSIGRFLAHGATNVLPDAVRLEGTFRSMDEAWRDQAHALIRRTVEHTAAAYGAEAEVTINRGYPALFNHAAPTAFVREAATEFVGADQVVDLDRWYVAEDFAYYLREKPGTFYLLGTGNEAADSTHGLHTPRFTIDEAAMRVGPPFMAYLAWKYGAAAARAA